MVTLSQEAYDKYAASVKPGGLLIVDDEKVSHIRTAGAIMISITRLAFETTGKAITANTVALGVLVGLTGVVSRSAIEKAVAARTSRHCGNKPQGAGSRVRSRGQRAFVTGDYPYLRESEIGDMGRLDSCPDRVADACEAALKVRSKI